MAEIMLVLLFLLLVLLGSKIQKLSDEVKSAHLSGSAEHDSVTLLENTLVELKRRNVVSADRDIEWLSERLVLSAEPIVKATGDYKFDDLESVAELKEQLGRLTRVSDDLRADKERLAEELHSAESLKKRLSLDEELIGIVTDRNITPSTVRQCLLNCGSGPKACWGSSLAKPDYIYNVALFDDHVVVSPDLDSVKRNQTDWNVLPVQARIEETVAMSTVEFRKAFSSLRKHSESRDCVYQTRVIDQKTTSKDSYKEKKRMVDDYTYSSIFYRWVYGKIPKY